MYAPASVSPYEIQGMFVEAEFKKRFQFVNTQNEWALQNGFPHEIFVGDGIRFGLIKKTVALICVDESESGPVTEKWQIRHEWHFPIRNAS